MTQVKRAMIDNVNAGRADTANDGVRRSKDLSREVNRLAEQCALSQPDTSNLHEAFEAVDQKKKKRTHPRQISQNLLTQPNQPTNEPIADENK